MICVNCTEKVPDGNFCPSCGKSPLLDGRYRLDRVVGHGANGTTYRATLTETGEVVAIKELLVRKVESLKALELFQREVRVLEELDHPGVPHFIEELHDDAGRSMALYLVQEFIDGRTIADEFDERRGTEHEVFELAAELLDTLTYLHNLRPPLIHRDIKPSNIMRRAGKGRLVLIDFGSVRDAIDTDEGGSTVAGTFGYMAPEQFLGRAVPATDIYGVGATVVALLSRRDPQTLLGADRTIDWEGKLGLSRPFAALLRTMLAADVGQRASDAAAVAEQIRAALRGEFEVPVEREPVGLDSPPAPPVPPAPRELPPNFVKTYAAGASFNRMFGGIFAGAGVLAGGIMIAIAIPVAEWTLVILGLFFFAVFGGVGFISLRSALMKIAAARAAYRNGVPTDAVITRIGSSSYQVNNRSATIYHFEFYADGVAMKGDHHSWASLDLDVGDTVTVLHDVTSEPTSRSAPSVLFAPEQFDASARVRQRLERQHRSPLPRVSFDLRHQKAQAAAEETVDATHPHHE